ncbi:MAG TPA: hypothetical protein VGB79_06995 [Allosphingosinicella sp.]|jgi:hypothetical protein
MTITLLACLLGGCGPANVYDIPPAEAYAKLIQLEHGTSAVIEVEGVREAIHGTPGQSVTWVTDSAHSYYECTAYLTPEGPERTSINVGCSDANAPAKFAIAGAVVGQIAGDAPVRLPGSGSLAGVRNRYIELVDSALDGRSFDPVRARSQVMGWPGPPT